MLGMAFRLARRELRSGTRGMRVVLACLALGVAAIAGVGTLREAIFAGLAADGRRILGGDLDIQTTQRPLPEEIVAWLATRGGVTSRTIEMRAMAVNAAGERQLVELKAVDERYPLVGELVLAPPARAPFAAEGGVPGVALDPVVMDRLGLSPGASVRIGDATFRVAGAIAEEPDRTAAPTVLGPRAMIGYAALPATNLIQPGSLIQYETRVALPAGTDPRAISAELRSTFPEAGMRIRDTRQAAPGVTQWIERTALFMTLVGLTALLVGGIGVANGVRAWIEARARSVAVLRAVGAPPGLVVASALIQVLVLSALGVAIGLAVGTLLPLAAPLVLGDALPVPPRFGIYPMPLLSGAAFGLLTAATFALWPVARAGNIPGAALFRDRVADAGGRPGWGWIAANAALALALVALTVATAPDRRFALAFCGGAAATLLLFRIGAWGLMALARRAPRVRRPWLRLGLANIHRPGSPAPLMLVSLGLGLATLAAVALIEGNVRRQVVEQMPANAPSFFFIDIQSNQVPRFDGIVAASAGVEETLRVPSLRARIVAVNGVPAEQVQATPDTAWALRGDRGLTYTARPPEGTRLTAGTWWPADYRGPPLVSFDANLARGWGLEVGGTITVNVLGRNIDLRVASLRDIAWRNLGMNFTLVASPGLLEAAPHTHIATVRTTPEAEAPLLRAVGDALPNVSAIRVRDALEAVAQLLGRIAAALSATGGITLVAGALVLAGAVAAGQRRRIYDAVVMKTLGMTRSQIRASFLVEFGLLGLAAGTIAALVGTGASWAVTRFVMNTDWAFLPGTLAATLLACVGLTLAFGWAGTALALRAKASPLLRNE
jgi:putative ABC transport system permease protein